MKQNAYIADLQIFVLLFIKYKMSALEKNGYAEKLKIMEEKSKKICDEFHEFTDKLHQECEKKEKEANAIIVEGLSNNLKLLKNTRDKLINDKMMFEKAGYDIKPLVEAIIIYDKNIEEAEKRLASKSKE